MRPIQMVDLSQQYLKIKDQVDAEIGKVLESSAFIKGKVVGEFEEDLGKYLDDSYVIGCGNGTDALQIALMALDLKPGEEVIVPSFTYIATVEVITLLGLVPVLVDVYPDTFNINVEGLDEQISENTKAIIPVHLYGQAANLSEIIAFAKKHNLYVIEDTAQGIGGTIEFEGEVRKLASISDIGCLSFFPSKNLGCYGDGGALVTKNKALAEKIRMVANHGQKVKYKHDIIGVNSRLDSIQAAILKVKLPHLEAYITERRNVANKYDTELSKVKDIIIPKTESDVRHVYHQYTIRVPKELRDALKLYLSEKGIPSMIYYPIPVHQQQGYQNKVRVACDLTLTEDLTATVLSLPIHTEMDEDQQNYIIDNVIKFFETC